MSALENLNLGWGGALPMVLQTEAAECGLACLCMIAQYYRLRRRASRTAAPFRHVAQGATLKDLIGVADQIGFAARPLRLELDELPQLELPCILHWDLNHFVVLASVRAGCGH